MNYKKFFVVLSVLFLIPLMSVSAANVKPVPGWQSAGYVGLNERLRSLAVYNNNLYTGQDVGYVYRYGANNSWQVVGQPGQIYGSAVTLINWNNQLYTGSYGSRFYVYSSDNQWLDLGETPNTCGILSLEIYNNALYLGTEDCWGTGYTEIYKYGPDAVKMVSAGSLPRMFFVNSLKSYGGRLYAGGNGDGGAYIYAYNGQDWQSLGTIGPYAYSGPFFVLNHSFYAAADDSCVYKQVSATGKFEKVFCIGDYPTAATVAGDKAYIGGVYYGDIYSFDGTNLVDTGAAGVGTTHALLAYQGWLYAAKADGTVFKYNLNSPTPVITKTALSAPSSPAPSQLASDCSAQALK